MPFLLSIAGPTVAEVAKTFGCNPANPKSVVADAILSIV